MKLKASVIPYSSIVGGGIILSDESGGQRFQLAIMGTRGLTKEQHKQITDQLIALINNAGGIEIK